MKSDSVPLPHVRFGPFEVDFETGEVRKHGLKLKLQEKPLRVLQALVEKPGKLVTREDLRSKLWPEDHYVDFDRNLTIAINRLRTVLSDSADEPRYIETLPRRGYRFIYPMDGKGLPGSDATLSEGVPSNRAIPGLLARHRKATIGTAAIVMALIGLVWFPRRRHPQSSSELTQKRLTFNSNENAVDGSALSPDGKYLAYSDPAGIHIKLVASGEERVLPRPAGLPPGAWWGAVSWFPDGTQLLGDLHQPDGHVSIWTLSVLGQSARQLREAAMGFGVSPDGTHVAFCPEPGPSGLTREVWVMDSQGGNPQKVLALGENRSLSFVHWSPDGQRLGYVTEQRTRGQTSIETCDLKGANRTVIMRGGYDGWLEDLCWLRDGRMVYSRQDPDSSNDNLWQIGIDGRRGTPTGQPKRITPWAGSYIERLSASSDGKRLTLQKYTYQDQVYLGQLAAGGTRMSPPRRLTNDEADDEPTAWTPDSKAVLFTSDRNGRSGVFKQAIDEDAAEPVVTGPQDVEFARLSADGAWILYMEIPKTAGPNRLMRIPVRGGVPQLVLETRDWWNMECASTPASLCVLLEQSSDKKQWILTAVDPLKGRGKVLRTIPKDPATFYADALSPDGTTFAISKGDQPEIHVRLLSLSGGTDREIAVKGWPNVTGLDWSPDGKGLYIGSYLPQGRTLLYVDLKGNARVVWQVKGRAGRGGVLRVWGLPSPDGRYLAIFDPVYNSNVWMLEGF